MDIRIATYVKTWLSQKDHSTPNGSSFVRFGHDPSENLIRTCQVVIIYKIWQSGKFSLKILYGSGKIALQS